MPVLKDFRLTKTISLKEHEGSEIIIFNSVLSGESDKLMNLQEEQSIKAMINALPLFIKSWNFTDESGKSMKVTSQALNYLGENGLAELIEEIKTFTTDTKKNSDMTQ